MSVCDVLPGAGAGQGALVSYLGSLAILAAAERRKARQEGPRGRLAARYEGRHTMSATTSIVSDGLSPLAAVLVALEQSEQQLLAKRDQLDQELTAAQLRVRAAKTEREGIEAQLGAAREAIANMRRASGINVQRDRRAPAPDRRVKPRGGRRVNDDRKPAPPPIPADALLAFLKKHGPSAPGEIEAHFKVTRHQLNASVEPLLEDRAIVATGVTRGRRYALPGAAKEAVR